MGYLRYTCFLSVKLDFLGTAPALDALDFPDYRVSRERAFYR